MAITLKANNKTLLSSATSISYLSANYLSGVTSLVVTNSSGFNVELGDSTTEFTITNPSGDIFLYTYTGTGTSPGTLSNLMRTSGSIVLNAQNFNANNNGTFTLLTVGEDYFTVTNASGVAEANKTIGTGTIKLYKYALLGDFGSEQSEVVQITDVATATDTLTVSTTKFSHSESTKVTIIPYNQVRFYHTDTAVYSTIDPISEFTDIDADSNASTVKDTSNSTGFGWFVFSNETTGKVTINSNAIPYAGFGANSVKTILDNFFSILNNKEKKLINDIDAMSWLNEGYSIMKTELNLVNKTYSTVRDNEITTVPGTAEYDLESNFSKVIAVWDVTNGRYLNYIEPQDVPGNNATASNDVMYYMLGSQIGFSPLPTSESVYRVTYSANTSVLTSYYDTVDLPNNSYYSLKDFMMYRAASKLNRSDGETFYGLFLSSIERLKMTSFKQDNNNDSWGIAPGANV